MSTNATSTRLVPIFATHRIPNHEDKEYSQQSNWQLQNPKAIAALIPICVLTRNFQLSVQTDLTITFIASVKDATGYSHPATFRSSTRYFEQNKLPLVTVKAKCLITLSFETSVPPGFLPMSVLVLPHKGY